MICTDLGYARVVMGAVIGSLGGYLSDMGVD